MVAKPIRSELEAEERFKTLRRVRGVYECIKLILRVKDKGIGWLPWLVMMWWWLNSLELS